MSIKRRLDKAEGKLPVGGRVPLKVIGYDEGKSLYAGQGSREAWGEEYGDRAHQLREEGRQTIFGVDFRAPTQSQEEKDHA